MSLLVPTLTAAMPQHWEPAHRTAVKEDKTASLRVKACPTAHMWHGASRYRYVSSPSGSPFCEARCREKYATALNQEGRGLPEM